MAASTTNPARWHTAALALAAIAVAACTQRADVVAHALRSDSGARDAGAVDAGSSAPEPCSASARVRRTPWPPEVVAALLIPTSCTIPWSAFTTPAGADAGITQDEFRNLFSTQPTTPSGSTPSRACDSLGRGIDINLMKHQFVLCSSSCSGFKRLLTAQLAQDGCDGPYDAGPLIDFPFTLPPRLPTMHDAGSQNDDAGTVGDAG
ncbi:MAG TPA: hypothetical protein VF331_16670 [Polyangiales bacterium]